MVFAYIKKAFNAYKRNFTTIIGALLIVYAIVFGLIMVGLIPLVSNAPELFLQGSLQTENTEQLDLLIGDTASIGSSIALFVLLMAIAIILGMILQAGLIRTYADCLKGKGKILTMFKIAKQKFLTILGANLILLLIMGGIILLFTIPMMLA